MNNNNGFTLIELLVTLAVSGILMAGVYTTFQSQQNSYLAQDQVSEMQQNIRAGLHFLISDLRMSGFDGGFDITHSSCNVPAAISPVAPGLLATTAAQLDFSKDLNFDGDCADAGENLSYYVYVASDGVSKLGRRDNNNLPVQALAENIQGIEFRYLDNNGAVTATLANIRSVQISILARAGNTDRNFTDTNVYTTASGTVWGPFNDNIRRRFQIVDVQLRNAGI